MTTLDEFGDPDSPRVRRMQWWREAKQSFAMAWFGAMLPFAGLVAFFLVAGLFR